ncbi:MAG TPA: 4-alpha-glucanotransferase [Stellaceae bacterium]
MSRLDELRRVAKLIGIGTRHVDALGAVHEPDEDTLSRLIAAFGLPSEPEQAADALTEESRNAPFGLPPVHIVAHEATHPMLRLRLAVDIPIEWNCRFEDGTEASGRSSAVPAGGDRSDEAMLPLPAPLPLGYHRLELSAGAVSAQLGLIVAPSACHLHPVLHPGARSWGLTAQLYGLRSSHDWGIGDFTDLARLCRDGAPLGAAAIGVNPLHALFAAEPRHLSPYSPSSRAHLDYLYIDVTAVPGFAEDAAVRALVSPGTIAAAQAAELVDYAAVAAAKRPVLEALFQRFRDRELGSKRDARSATGGSFRLFQRQGGDGLRAFALFEALHEHFSSEGRQFSWHDWPATMRDPNSEAVADFARANTERVEFFQFLQWEADRQLGVAAATGQRSGLAIGLYRDLAVGVNPNGAEAWADQQLIAPGAAIGAPPDPLSRAGQDWGLAPINPLVLRRRGFAPIIAALRSNMRHAGVLRIDHVMGLQRLYWIPSGSPAPSGAYVNYPFDELLRLVALESQRHRCAVIGEDLGTLPEGFREKTQAANVLSYRILAFERRQDGKFIPPREYPPLAAASAATHDLATLKGFWLGRDIEWRRRLRLYPDAAAEATELQERRRDRRFLLEALVSEGLLAPQRCSEFLGPDGEPTYSTVLGEAVHAYLACSRARLMLVQLEDIVGESEQANLPGTDDEHPNWRRRLSRTVEDLLTGSETRRLAELVTAARRKAGEASEG